MLKEYDSSLLKPTHLDVGIPGGYELCESLHNWHKLSSRYESTLKQRGRYVAR